MANPFYGSRDTGHKLQRLKQYLQAYAVALKDKGFARLYIDAFAGTGSRTEIRAAIHLLDPDSVEPEIVHTPGSARIAASIEPPFDLLVLVENDPERFEELKTVVSEFPQRKIKLHRGDANEAVRKLCAGIPWHRKQGQVKGMRGVIFLDPFGMEVEWATVEAIARTEALDCWYFFPLSGLYRNAPHEAPRLDAAKRDSLNRVFGTSDWFDHWYHNATPSDMFDAETEAVRLADVDAMERYVRERLLTVFRGAVMPPLRLFHDNGAPLASFFFAVSNPHPAAVELATRIAGHILKPGSSSQVRS